MSARQKLKIGLVSLGCSKNQIDAEMMLSRLDDAGYEMTGEREKADVIIVNTCGFIGDAQKESVEAINEAAKLKKTGKLKKLIVTGCLAERWRDRIMEKNPQVDAVVGVGGVQSVVEAVAQTFKREKVTLFAPCDKGDIDGARLLLDETASACLRVSEGCNNRCSYCAIPFIRGKYRSRTMESIIEEAQDLAAAGVKELNLIAQDTSCYGVDLYQKPMLPELLRRLASETDIPWIRLFYCYPDKITDELVAEIKNNPRVLHYIDIPVQHISDEVLKRMHRHGGRALIESVIQKLRREIPDIVIRTTAIVGFPGETQEQFDELLDFVKTVKFNRFGAFMYSREEGTAAFDMPDQIDEKTKRKRYDAVMRAQAKVSLEQQKACIGQIRDVLVEEFDDEKELYAGRDYANGPNVDGKVFFDAKGRAVEAGDFVKVRITDADEYDLYGEIAD